MEPWPGRATAMSRRDPGRRRQHGGSGEGATGSRRGGGPDRPLDAEQFLGDLARENAQLRDDVVLGRRGGEERPGVLPVSRSVAVASMLYPFPSLETVPWSRRGTFASFAAASGGFPPAGRSTTSAPASAIRREASRRGRTETVAPISSFVRDANGAMAMRREYPAADAGTGDARTQERRRKAPRTARATCRTEWMRIAPKSNRGEGFRQ